MPDGYLPRQSRGHELGDSIDEQFRVADDFLAGRICAVVERHYLGQPFSIKVSHRQGVVMIQIPLLMGPVRWHVIYIDTLAADPGFKSVIRACGEILERYNIPRLNFDRDHFLRALHAQPLGSQFHGYLPD